MSDAVAAPAAAAPTTAAPTTAANDAPDTKSGTAPPLSGTQSTSAPPDISALLAQIDSDDKIEALQRELIKRKPITIKTKHGEKKVSDFDKVTEYTRKRETLDEDLKRFREERQQLAAVQQKIEAIQNGDPGALQELLESNQGAMAHAARLLREQYEREQQLQQLTPEQRQMAERMQEMEAQLTRFQQKELQERQQREQQEREQIRAKARNEITSRAVSILRAMGYENGAEGAAYAIRTLVPILRGAMEDGVELTDAEAVEAMRKEHVAKTRDEFKHLSGKQLYQLYPDVAVKLLDYLRESRQAEVARLHPVAQNNTQRQEPEQPKTDTGENEWKRITRW